MTFKKIRNGYYIFEEDDNLSVKHTNAWWIGYDKRVAQCNHIVVKRNSRRDIFKEMNRIYGTGIKK